MGKYNKNTEARLQEAVEAIAKNKDLKIATVARAFNVPRLQLHRRLQGQGSLKDRLTTNKKLTDEQEYAICSYIDRLDRMSLRVRKELVRDAANLLLRETAPPHDSGPPPTVGINWVHRFLHRHGYSSINDKVLDAARQHAENVESFQAYFEQLKEAVEKYGIQEEDIWNMDETGFCIGVGKDQMVITRQKRESYFEANGAQPEDGILEVIAR
ncbi:putative transposase [Colletotrichum sublineola]|uniref:Putative transposase n=1 Tax=Colletotrichum sublineola TaxID=1173701 RepID=A0A066X6I7_COLSU|nr:putative transposase [Colletotrichum sublineola]